MLNPDPTSSTPQPNPLDATASRSHRRLRRAALGALVAAAAVASVASTAAADPTPSSAPATTGAADATAPGSPDATTPAGPGAPGAPGGPGHPGGPAGPATDDTLHAHGTVTSLDGDTLVLTGPQGETRTVTLTDDSVVVLDRGPGAGEESADRSALTVGSRVHADLAEATDDTADGDGTAVRIVVEPLRADGEVSAVDGTRITLSGPDGRSSVVDVAGAEVLLDGAVADASAVTVGQHVHAEAAAGTAAAEDGSFTATRVEVGRPVPPTPPTDAPTPPSGSPAAPSTDGSTPAPAVTPGTTPSAAPTTGS